MASSWLAEILLRYTWSNLCESQSTGSQHANHDHESCIKCTHKYHYSDVSQVHPHKPWLSVVVHERKIQFWSSLFYFSVCFITIKSIEHPTLVVSKTRKSEHSKVLSLTRGSPTAMFDLVVWSCFCFSQKKTNVDTILTCCEVLKYCPGSWHGSLHAGSLLTPSNKLMARQ